MGTYRILRVGDIVHLRLSHDELYVVTDVLKETKISSRRYRIKNISSEEQYVCVREFLRFEPKANR